MLPKLLDIVMQGQRSILHMKERGLLVDREKMHNLQISRIAEGSKVEAQLSSVLGMPGFNPRSQDEVGKVLYGTMGFQPQWKRAKRGQPAPKKPTTDDTTIQKLCGIKELSPGVFEPLPDSDPDAYLIGTLILKARQSTKLASTYYSLKCDEDSRVHPDWKMHGTETGRLACSAPPVQTYPPGDPRSIFIAPPGFSYVYGDLSQIEFRIIIWLSKDSYGTMLLKQGGDIHRKTACELFNKPPEDILGEERFQAKFVNFGLIYGRGPDSMARQHKLTLDKAQDIYNAHRRTFRDLWEYLAGICQFSAQHKYIANPYGRRRWFIDTPDDERERQTQNMVAQSTAHDILLQILNDIDQELPLVHPVIDMHDALLCECPNDYLDVAVPKVKEIFERERLPGLFTPTDIKVVKHFGEIKR